MADDALEEEGKAKLPILKIILVVVGVLIVVALTIGATLYASGFFDAEKEEDAEAALAALEAEAAAAKAGPDKVQLDSPELSKFQQSYYELEKELTSNVSNSRRVMQANVAIMTHYDDRVVANVEKHVFALRNEMLIVMSAQTEADLQNKNFREELAEELKIVMNAKLEQLEDFGGIEAVYFTNFIIQ